jgi:hypothetical protein
MSKELEAIIKYAKKRIEETQKNKTLLFVEEHWNKEKIEVWQSILDKQELLKQALTPPTAEEVCEALENHFTPYGYKKYGVVVFEDNCFVRKFNNDDRYIFIINQRELLVQGNYPLPPHLIILIGRFYEGQTNENK